MSKNVTPLSLGIETLGGVMTRVIDRDTPLPTRNSVIFSTSEDEQKSVHVKVYQGEREIAVHNKLLGDMELTGLVPAPRSVPHIEVTLDIDANGILNVSARDHATSREQRITIAGAMTLESAEIERMIRDAEQHAAEDRRQREEAETRVEADALVHQTARLIRQVSDRVPMAVTAPCVQQVFELQRALRENADMQRVRSLMKDLRQSSYDLAQYLAPSAGDE